MGHSNGAMMVQRLACETRLFAAIVPISGPLNLPAERCPAARGQRILAIHGAADENVPIAGGRGPMGISGVAYASEDHSRRVFETSGATYDLRIIPNADHRLDNIEAAIEQTDHRTLQNLAAHFFGLTGEPR